MKERTTKDKLLSASKDVMLDESPFDTWWVLFDTFFLHIFLEQSHVVDVLSKRAKSSDTGIQDT